MRRRHLGVDHKCQKQKKKRQLKTTTGPLQTRSWSFLEALLNTAVGYCVAVVSQILLFPKFNIEVTFRTHLILGASFTIISLCRSYLLRRVFQHIQCNLLLSNCGENVEVLKQTIKYLRKHV